MDDPLSRSKSLVLNSSNSKLLPTTYDTLTSLDLTKAIRCLDRTIDTELFFANLRSIVIRFSEGISNSKRCNMLMSVSSPGWPLLAMFSCRLALNRHSSAALKNCIACDPVINCDLRDILSRRSEIICFSRASALYLPDCLK